MKKFVFILLSTLIYYQVDCQIIKSDKNDLKYAFIEAIKSKEFGNLGQSAYLLQKYIENDSTCGACYYELSILFYYSKDNKSALAYAKKAVDFDNSNYWYLKNLAEIQTSVEKFVDAEKTYTIMLSYNLAKLEDNFNHALVLFKLNKDKEALQILNKIENENGVSEIVSLARYKYFLSTRNLDKAENEIKKLISLDNDNLSLYGMLAELYAIQKKDDEALKNYKILLNSDSLNISALTSLGRFYFSRHDTVKSLTTFDLIFKNSRITLSKKIEAFIDFNKNSENSYLEVVYLKKVMQDMLAANPNNLKILELACDYYEHIKDFKNAVFNCKLLTILAKKEPTYWERLFYYYNLLGNYNEILSESDSVLFNFSSRPFIYFITGLANYQTNKIQSSLPYFVNGYKLSSGNEFLNGQFISFLTEAYYKIGMKDSSYFYFEIGINKNKRNYSLMNNYAYYLAENNDNLEKALNMSLETIENEPENATYLDTYAWILYKQKVYKSAYKYIKLALKFSDKKNSDIFEHYGNISFCFGKKNDAIKKWRESILLGGDKNRLEKKIINFLCE
jgi:tetratricopeptide (TPR) repeat protein